jgi:hypothetical protein
MDRPAPRPAAPRLSYPKAGFAALAGGYGLLAAWSPSTYRFLDRVDLIFHEAGHPLFGLFGEFLGLLGGTLMQLLIPAACAAHFFRSRQSYSGSIVLIWLAQSLFNVSVYVRDARARALPLLGDDPSAHDWHQILGRLGLLRLDQAIGGLVYGVGFLVLLVAILGALHHSREREADEV